MPRRAATVAGQEPLVGKRYALGMRVSHDIRAKLEEAANSSGRSMTAEAERRLEDSFRREHSALDALSLKYGDRFAKVIITAAEAGLHAGKTYGATVAHDRGDGIENWDQYPTAFQKASETMEEVLVASRPVGGMKELPATGLKSPREIAEMVMRQLPLIGIENIGLERSTADQMLREMQAMQKRLEEMQAKIGTKL
jgi:predicted transcriptional regulator